MPYEVFNPTIISLLDNQNNHQHYGVLHEKDLPEVAHALSPKGLIFLLGAFIIYL